MGSASDESLRRGLAQIASAPNEKHNETEREQQEKQVSRAEQWMKQALFESVQHALDTSWILDIDTTVKTLFGKQSGAEVSYNPHKPGPAKPRSAYLLDRQPAAGAASADSAMSA